jgi:hypothetical protein
MGFTFTDPVADPVTAKPETTRDIFRDGDKKVFSTTLDVSILPDPSWIDKKAESVYGTDAGGNTVVVSVKYTYNLKDDLGNWIIDNSLPHVWYSETINDSAGNDHIKSINGGPTIYANHGGDNYIELGMAYDVVIAGAGNDYITSGGGQDNIKAGDGNNYVDAGAGQDLVESGKGNDTLISDKDSGYEARKSASLVHRFELQKRCRRQLQRRGQAADIDQRDIALSAFHAAQITASHTRLQRQRLLRPATRLAQLRQTLAEQSTRINRRADRHNENMLSRDVLSGHAL